MKETLLAEEGRAPSPRPSGRPSSHAWLRPEIRPEGVPVPESDLTRAIAGEKAKHDRRKEFEARKARAAGLLRAAANAAQRLCRFRNHERCARVVVARLLRAVAVLRELGLTSDQIRTLFPTPTHFRQAWMGAALDQTRDALLVLLQDEESSRDVIERLVADREALTELDAHTYWWSYAYLDALAQAVERWDTSSADTVVPARQRQQKDLPVLGERQQRFRDILLERAPHDAITGVSLCQLYGRRHPHDPAPEEAFRETVVPALKAWGLRNRPKVGYYFPKGSAARREAHG